MSPIGLLILEKCIESKRQLVLRANVAQGIALWAVVDMLALKEYSARIGVSILR
jgi:hypothetical protein